MLRQGGAVRVVLVVAILAAFGLTSPVASQDEPVSEPIEVDASQITAADIAATVQVAVAGTVSAWLTSQPTAVPTAVPTSTATPATVAATPQGLTMAGHGTVKTTPFELAGGNYSIDWAATDPTGFGCIHTGSLKNVDGTFNAQNAGTGRPTRDASSRTGTTQAYNVKPGRYYLDVISGCDWTITLTPQR